MRSLLPWAREPDDRIPIHPTEQPSEKDDIRPPSARDVVSAWLVAAAMLLILLVVSMPSYL